MAPIRLGFRSGAALVAATAMALALSSVAILPVAAGARSANSMKTAKAEATAIPKARALPGLTLGFSSYADALLGPSYIGSTAYSHHAYAAWARRAQTVGAEIVRIDVSWAWLAPLTVPAGFDASNSTSPGYNQSNWAVLDDLVKRVAADHFKILLMVNSAPSWAEGPGMPADAIAGTWKPNAVDFGQFATALATRYDGSFEADGTGPPLPRVSYWQPWNEPNLHIFLAPQWTKTPHGYEPASPTLYRTLENAFYRAVKHVSPSNYVLAAGTAPYGGPPGGLRMRPVAFDRSLFCLTAQLQRASDCPGPTNADGIDAHPYTQLPPTTHAYLSDDVGPADVYKLTRVVAAARRVGTVTPEGRKDVWVTEVGWNTNPPNRTGVSAQAGARWLEQALYLLWKQGVSSVLWLQLGDLPPQPAVGLTYPIATGVYFENGEPKPSATAFRFPFLGVERRGETVLTWGRAPAAGTLVIQAYHDHRWQTIRSVVVSARQVFEEWIPLGSAAMIRATVDNIASLAWNQPM